MPSDDSSSTQPSRRQIFGTGLAAAIVVSLPSGARAEGETFKNPSDLGDGYLRFYGEATTSSSYGGYGGNENNFDKFKYYYDIPRLDRHREQGREVHKRHGQSLVQSKSSGEKVYCVTLTGYNRLKRIGKVSSPISHSPTITSRMPSSPRIPSRLSTRRGRQTMI